MSPVAFGIRRRFDPVAARDLDATFELDLSGRPYAVRVRGGRCQVERRPAPEAGARVRISLPDVLRLITGSAKWTVLLAQGRLQLDGDPFLALRFPRLFGVGPRR